MKKQQPELSAYEALAAVVVIRDLSLIESSSRVDPKFITGGGQLTVEPPHYFGAFLEPETAGEGQTLVCGIKLGMKLVAKEPFFQVNAEYQVTYSVPKGSTFEAEAAMVFAGRNAVFNVWPFFRELVWGLASKSGFPPTVIPLFKLPIGGP